MKMLKNNLDEMQEHKLLKIEHNGMWFAFWGLFIVILLQMVIEKGEGFRSIAGEFIVFMCLCIYIFVACMKNNIWDRKLKPNLKTNFILSIAGGSVTGLIFFTKSLIQYDKLEGAIMTGVIMFIFVFILTLFLLSISALLYKKRVKKAEESIEKESDDI